MSLMTRDQEVIADLDDVDSFVDAWIKAAPYEHEGWSRFDHDVRRAALRQMRIARR